MAQRARSRISSSGRLRTRRQSPSTSSPAASFRNRISSRTASNRRRVHRYQLQAFPLPCLPLATFSSFICRCSWASRSSSSISRMVSHSCRDSGRMLTTRVPQSPMRIRPRLGFRNASGRHGARPSTQLDRSGQIGELWINTSGRVATAVAAGSSASGPFRLPALMRPAPRSSARVPRSRVQPNPPHRWPPRRGSALPVRSPLLHVELPTGHPGSPVDARQQHPAGLLGSPSGHGPHSH